MRVLVRSRLETPSPPNIVRRDEIVGHELGMPGHRASTYRRGPRHPAVRRAIPAGGSAMMSDEPVGEGYLAGQILIAMPSMSDPRFARTVIYLRSEEQTSELQSLMRISYSVFFLKKKEKTET